MFFHFFDLGLTEHRLVGVADLVGVESLELFEDGGDVIANPLHDEGEEEGTELVEGAVGFVLRVFEGLDADAVLRLELEGVGVVVDDDDFAQVTIEFGEVLDVFALIEPGGIFIEPMHD